MSSITTAQRRQAHLAGIPTDNAEFNLYLPNSVTHVPLRSQLQAGSGLTVTSGTAYWVFLGHTSRPVNAQQIYFFVSTVAAGTRVQELVIASTPSAPNRANQTVTVLSVANATGDYTAATGVFTNTTAFNYIVPAATYLWVGCRFALTNTPTQPTIPGLTLDQGRGEILTTAASGVLTAGSTYTGSIITQSTTLTTVMAPDLSLTISTT